MQMLRFAQHDRRFLHTFCAFPESTSGIVRSRLRLNRRRVASPKNQKLDCRQSESREPVKKSAPVILSEAKDPRSFPWFNNLRTTAEILRCAQDDTFRISSHVPDTVSPEIVLSILDFPMETYCRRRGLVSHAVQGMADESRQSGKEGSENK